MREKLYTGVICDTLDELGYRNQAMRENVRPLAPAVADNVVGRAKTILAADVYYVNDNPYLLEIQAIDSIRPDELVVASTNGSVRNGIWGELLSTASKMRGAIGAIVDGLVRDTKKIAELGFPVYAAGVKPVDSRGRGMVVDYDCPIEAGGVAVAPGDVVFADCDGVAVIPATAFEQTVMLALEKAERENNTRTELLAGKLLREVFAKYGVL
ncbi:RraA family protein [Cohnella sp. CBP 2801]|uniref:Putative 4-hydroxy-4-methyl-2-oxoglutarate aldolase n=2 Tax=Cohnella zeiphila TaxID=2761120 RepID=A0A7X0SVM8_9BACL|nr:RraA family protein [Cohnella zeiphila]